MKYLKTRKDSGALAFQRAVGKRFKARARALGISDPIVMPLNISQGAPDTDIAAALKRCNEQYETLRRFLAQTDIRAVQKAELEEAAKAYVEIKALGLGISMVWTRSVARGTQRSTQCSATTSIKIIQVQSVSAGEPHTGGVARCNSCDIAGADGRNSSTFIRRFLRLTKKIGVSASLRTLQRFMRKSKVKGVKKGYPPFG